MTFILLYDLALGADRATMATLQPTTGSPVWRLPPKRPSQSLERCNLSLEHADDERRRRAFLYSEAWVLGIAILVITMPALFENGMS